MWARQLPNQSANRIDRLRAQPIARGDAGWSDGFLPLAPVLGAGYNLVMRVIALKTLRDFWEQHPDVEQVLRAWYHDAKGADWRTPSDIKAVYRTASFIGHNRVVFNIKGNQYRLIVAIQYQFGIVYIRFIGTHRQYDQIDATTI